MATLINSTLFIFFFIAVSTIICKPYEALSQDVSESMVAMKPEKISHLKFYFHDIVSGKNPTAKKIIGENAYSFGTTAIIDDPLTNGPELTSELVGRAQGIYSIASQSDLALLMVVTFEFTSGKYNGSSVCVQGRNHVVDDVREMPIVGGTKLFRFARGYALAHTFFFDVKTGDATVEYNVFVRHY